MRAALNRRWRARNVLGVHHVDFSFASVHFVKMDVFRLNRTDEVLEPDLIATQLALYNLSLITWRGKPARHRQWTWFNKTLNHRYLACELLSTVWVAHLHLQNGLRPAVWDRFRFPALPQCRSESVQSSFSAFFFFLFSFFFWVFSSGYFLVVSWRWGTPFRAVWGQFSSIKKKKLLPCSFNSAFRVVLEHF